MAARCDTWSPYGAAQRRFGCIFRTQHFAWHRTENPWHAAAFRPDSEAPARTRHLLAGRGRCIHSGVLTVLEDPLHVQAVGGAGLVVGAALQVAGQLPRPGVVDDPRVGGADGVWNTQARGARR